MLKHRLFIAFFTFFLILMGPLYTLAFCILESEIPAKSSGQDRSFISCVDEKSSFLSAPYPAHKKIDFPDMEERVGNVYHLVFSQEKSASPVGPSGAVFVPLTIPIYQLKTAYRI